MQNLIEEYDEKIDDYLKYVVNSIKQLNMLY